MAKLLRKLFILMVLVFVANILLRQFVYQALTPYYWGSRLIADKHQVILQEANYNLLFIGSSKTNCQIEPLYFDSLVNSQGQASIQSFNYGVNSLLPTESFYFYENLLDQGDLDGIKFVVMEFSCPPNPRPQNLHKRRQVYWLEGSKFLLSYQLLWGSNRPITHKVWSSGAYLVNFIDNQINLGIYNELSNFYAGSNDEVILDFGAEGTIENPNSVPNLIVKRGHNIRPPRNHDVDDFKKLEKKLEGMRKVSAKYFTQHEENPIALKNKAFLNKAEQLIAKSKEKGVHLIFTMTRQWRDYQYKELIPIFEQLDPAHKIIFADSRKYPDLFAPEYALDPDHLDSVGSRILTKILAEQFLSNIGEGRSAPVVQKD